MASLVAALGVPPHLEAQHAAKVYRIGVLVAGPPATDAELAQSPLVSMLRELGWLEGRNVAFERRSSMVVDQLNSFAAELVHVPVDVVFASGTPAVLAAKRRQPISLL